MTQTFTTNPHWGGTEEERQAFAKQLQDRGINPANPPGVELYDKMGVKLMDVVRTEPHLYFNTLVSAPRPGEALNAGKLYTEAEIEACMKLRKCSRKCAEDFMNTFGGRGQASAAGSISFSEGEIEACLKLQPTLKTREEALAFLDKHKDR